MKKIKNSLIFLLLSANIVNLFAANLTTLLKEYKKESALWKKTKKESSGILYLYTREDLEKMQVKSLVDVLKTVPGINLYRGLDNLFSISMASNSRVSSSAIRIFINDHDVSSAFFGSSFLIWGDLNIEYIDHIEIYKATSSVAFGAETAPLFIKLYTKRADREEGGKIRAMLDQKGSLISNLYIAKTVNEDFSYFIYGEGENFNNKTYEREYQNRNYNLKRDSKDYNFYSNFIYKGWFFELSAIEKCADNFLGIGLKRTPDEDGNGLNARQKYIHITKKFDNGLKLQLSLDYIEYNRKFKDLNGIRGLNNFVTSYTLKLDDYVYYASLEKEIKSEKNRFFVGAFNKYKTIDEKNSIVPFGQSDTLKSSYSKSFDYSSFYAEDEFKVLKNISILGQFKKDFYDYEKEIGGYAKTVYRGGVKYKDEKLFFEFLYTHTYLPVAFYQYYNPAYFPAKANSKLTPPSLDIFTAVSKYRFSDGYIRLALAKHIARKAITYMPNTGFINFDNKIKYETLELSYYKEIDDNNNIELAFYDSYNYSDRLFSPKWGANFRLFNTFDKFDIYNELVFKSSFNSPYNIKIKRSYDWTASVKYHVNKDFSIGIRGENILNKGLKQAYRGLSYAVPVVEQKFWLNVEYMF